MVTAKRATDADHENHMCEREFCPHHELHSSVVKSIEDRDKEIWGAMSKRVTWIVFSMFLTAGITVAGWSYLALNGRVVENSARLNKVEVTLSALPTKEDIKELKVDIKDMLKEHGRRTER